MRKALLASALALVAAASIAPAMAFTGHAVPEPQCSVNDYDPPTNVRTQPNGIIVGVLHNHDPVRVVDQVRGTTGSRGLWDFVEVSDTDGKWQPRSWIFDNLIICQ